MLKSSIRLLSENGSIKALSPAKINLFLEIIGRRRDGYHEIETIMQCVNLFDEITIKPAEKGITIKSNCNCLPTDRRNTVYKAISLIKKKTGLKCGVAVTIKKNIPIGAGLGGGSSNAATTIVAMNRLFNLNLTHKGMDTIAKQIGSDVPFFLSGSTALCTGRGEKVQPLRFNRKMHYVLLYQNIFMSTKKVYKNVKKCLTMQKADVNIFSNLLLRGSWQEVGSALFNRLECPALALNKKLKRAKTMMQKLGFLGVLMTGSGSGIYGLCKSKKDAVNKAAALKELTTGDVFILSSI